MQSRSTTSTNNIMLDKIDITINSASFHSYNLTYTRYNLSFSFLNAKISTDSCTDVRKINFMNAPFISTGTISVAGGLNREARPFYLLTVTVVDSGVNPGPLEGSTMVNVTILDANDNAPRFTKTEYTFSVTENDDQNVYVGVVTALDDDAGDNGKVTYSLLTPNG